MSAPSKERTSLLDWAFDWAPDAPTGPSRYLSSLTKTAAVAGVGILGLVLVAGRNRRYEAQTQREWNWLKKNWGPRTRANASQTHQRFEKEFKHPTDIAKKFHRDNILIIEEAAKNANVNHLAQLEIPVSAHMAFQMRGSGGSKQKQHEPYDDYQQLLLEAAADKIAPITNPAKREYRDEQIRNMKPFLTRLLVWQQKIPDVGSRFRSKKGKAIQRLKYYPKDKDVKTQIGDISRAAIRRAQDPLTKGILTEWSDNPRDFTEDMYELYARQEGRCAVTGMLFAHNKAWLRPSIDRIDSRRGYYPENVRLVLQCVNNLLNKFSDDMIVDLKMNNMRHKNLIRFRMPPYTADSSHCIPTAGTSKGGRRTWASQCNMVNDGLISFPEQVISLAVKYKNQLDLYTKAPYNFEVVN